VSAAPNVPGLVQLTRKSKRLAEKVLMTVNAVEKLRNKGGKKKVGQNVSMVHELYVA
jgi:hypothetical protein